MIRLVLLCLLATAAGRAGAADLPTVDQLPARPELPAALVMLDGMPVTTQSQWYEQRRPELKRLFQHYMYGYLPPAPPVESMRFDVGAVDTNYFGGKATRKLITIHYPPQGTPPIQLLLVIPDSPNPAPVFLGVNFRGNHAALDDLAIPLPAGWMYDRSPGVKDNRATEAGRGTQIDVWNIEKVIARGYGVATFYGGDIDPDKPDFSDGVHPHFYKEGQTEPGPHDWGTIAAWAWGLHRAVDYLTTDDDVDASRIAVVGHSRLGKTALLAAAFDERIAMAIPNQSGTGGAAPNRSRSEKAESVERINTNFPHWFNDTFPLFNEQVEKLPFDQHCLIALMAPRPVLLSNAAEDLWANPAGQFEMLQAAAPGYRLLGVEGFAATKMHAPGAFDSSSLIDTRLGYFLRPGKHAMTWDDWQAWLAFADMHFQR